MRVLGSSRGLDDETGKSVLASSIMKEANLSDIRFRVIMRLLSSKFLAYNGEYPRLIEDGLYFSTKWVDVVSLWEKGEEYVLKMGYAK